MTWFDIVALLLIVFIAWLESQRGFGRSILDLAGAIISLKVADGLCQPLASAAPLLGTPEGSEAFWFAAIFIVLAVLTVLGSKLIYETTLLSLDVLDPLVGAILGIASGVVVAHTFLKTALISLGGAEAADALLNTFAGQELLKFRTYHIVVTAMRNLGNW